MAETVTIVPNQDFKHEREAYEAGESYTVSSELAFYFQQCGWVGGEPRVTGESTTLEIQDVIEGQKSEVI